MENKKIINTKNEWTKIATTITNTFSNGDVRVLKYKLVNRKLKTFFEENYYKQNKKNIQIFTF